MAEKLNRDLDVDCGEGENIWHLSASIGIALVPDHGRCFGELYPCSDAALYETKKHGRKNYTLYRKEQK